MQVSVVAVHFVESILVCVGIMSKNQTEDFSILRSVNPIIFINSDKSLPDMLRMQDVVNVTSPPDGAFRVVASQEGWVINTVQVDRSEELRPGDFFNLNSFVKWHYQFRRFSRINFALCWLQCCWCSDHSGSVW